MWLHALQDTTVQVSYLRRNFSKLLFPRTILCLREERRNKQYRSGCFSFHIFRVKVRKELGIKLALGIIQV